MKKLAVKDSPQPARPSPYPYDIPPIFDESDYDRALIAIEELAERGAADDYHPDNSILSRILLALHAYERIHHPWPTADDLGATGV
jgi:hypothetical protein